MSDTPFRAVIFDLDGTLVDSAGEIAAALNASLFEEGLRSLARDRVEALIGRGVRVLVERALQELGAPGKLDGVLARFEGHYDRIVGTQAQLFAGVRAGLERLHASRVPMAVVTNKPRAFTLKLLSRLQADHFFAAIIAGDDGIRRKPHGDMLLAACERVSATPATALMLGDSDNDVRAAREAGCRVWCVPYGYNEGRPVESLACDRIVPSVEAAAARILGCDAPHSLS